MMTSSKTPASQFANAVDFFFGHNPSNPYWALVALAMRKVGNLEIVEDLSGKEGLVVLDENTSYLREESQPDLHIVCHSENTNRIYDILSSFREYESHNQSGSIFSRNQWERSILLNFASALIKLDENWLQSNFEKCFNVLVHRAFATSRFDEFSQPGELSEFVGHISNIIAPEAKIVYNPFSGLSSYALYMPKDAYYIGEEKFPLIAAIANLRLYAEAIKGEVRVADSIIDGNIHADLVVSTPPFGMRIQPESVNFVIDRVMTTEELILKKCLSQSVPAIVVVPRGFNYRKNSAQRLRQDLLDSDCLDMVINLPEKIFSNTTIGTSIYVLNPGHDHKGSVRFIDGTKSYIEQFRSRAVDVYSLVNIVDNDSYKSKFVPSDDIKKNDYNLSPERYFSDDIFVPEGMALMKISELGEIFRQSCDSLPAVGKLVNFGVLKNPNPIKIYRSEDFGEIELTNWRSLNLVHSGLLFFGGRGNLGICISSEGEPLYTNPDYINFVPNDELVLPQYLILQFHKEYVKDQLMGINVGRMPVDVFLNIRVLVPSLEKQRKGIEDYQERLIAELGIVVANLKTQQANEFERNMHLRKHALKQVLNEVVPATRRIANYINAQDGVFSKTAIIAERSQASLDDYTQKLYRNVVKIQRLISVLTDEEQFPAAETFDFSEFMAIYSHRKITGDKYRLIYMGTSSFLDDELELPSDLKLGEKFYVSAPTLTANIAPSAMESVLDNIIANATEHGFVDDSRRDYYSIKVLFKNIFVNDKMMLEVRVMNNGVKLPIGISSDKVFTWGVGRGTGLGSWQVKNIIEHYGGSVEFIQYDDALDGYNIEYRILIPMT